ncbi:MAG TPA: zinc-binding dehydrogenase [Candidatus Micrarchaeia archaeon]|nr:zinc-binding dehydrogenase [Candidatus Micrarchaeia archaeon]
MLAVYATAGGGDDPLANLVVGERPIPDPPKGFARVRVRAASLNHHDLWTLRGVGGGAITFPRTLGCDAAGVVDAYGPGTPEPLARGTAVVCHSVVTCGVCDECLGPDETLCRQFAMLSDGPYEGSLAEFVVVPWANCFPLPRHLDEVQASCLPTTYLTAFRMLFTRAGCRPGDTVLIQGAGGGVATAAEALALAAGLRVIVASRDPARRDRALGRGVHHAVEPGRGAASEILGLTAGRGVDAVIETVGEATWATSLRAIRPGGTVVVAGATTGANPPADLARVFWRQITVRGSTMGTRAEFRALLAFTETTGLVPLVDTVLPLREASEAFRRLQAGDVIGKLVLQEG